MNGAARQHKNKKDFRNLGHHKEDSNVLAEWHFFAASQGKGPSVGVGELSKCM
jgi:hypothetical protein